MSNLRVIFSIWGCAHERALRFIVSFALLLVDLRKFIGSRIFYYYCRIEAADGASIKLCGWFYEQQLRYIKQRT